MNGLHAALLELLARFISPIIAQGILRRALREEGIEVPALDRSGIRALAPRLEAAVKLFVEPGRVPAFRAGLIELAGAPTALEATKLTVKTEHDLTDALSETRRLCQLWRVRAITQQKVATVVSELARNIVSYTPGGTVELIPLREPSPKVIIRATDSGSGIPNLEQIMQGRYRSKTGLGKGLLGSKRLSTRFDVRSGRSGTVIEAELDL
jgi:serine/threonine-protein kinase RsbT